MRRGYEVNIGVLYNAEIDFVATSGPRTLYIQVAYSVGDEATAEREYGAFSGIKGEGEKILVTLDDEWMPVRDGVRHIPAWELGDALI